jgi:hypothetical protein
MDPRDAEPTTPMLMDDDRRKTRHQFKMESFVVLPATLLSSSDDEEPSVLRVGRRAESRSTERA